MATPSQKDRWQGVAGTYICHFALDIFQQVFLSSDEEGMLELCVVSLWLHQTTLLDMNHLPKTIWGHTHVTWQEIDLVWSIHMWLFTAENVQQIRHPAQERTTWQGQKWHLYCGFISHKTESLRKHPSSPGRRPEIVITWHSELLQNRKLQEHPVTWWRSHRPVCVCMWGVSTHTCLAVE